MFHVAFDIHNVLRKISHNVLRDFCLFFLVFVRVRMIFLGTSHVPFSINVSRDISSDLNSDVLRDVLYDLLSDVSRDVCLFVCMFTFTLKSASRRLLRPRYLASTPPVPH